MKRALWLLALLAGAAWADVPAPGDIDLGRALFHGQRAWSAAPQLPDGISLPVNAAACARCHGARGEGAREGGVAAPLLRGLPPSEVLGAAHDGVAANGRTLQAPMPRYVFSADEQRALAAYLALLGGAGDSAAGVDERTLHLATLVPRTGAMRGAADQAVGAMQSHFAQINAAGGVYGRELRLQTVEFDAASSGLPATLATLLRERRVFALVGSLVGPLPEAWQRELTAQEVPMLANLLPASLPPATPWVTHLLPSASEQLRQAAAGLRQRCGNAHALWLVRSSAPQQNEMAAPLGVSADHVIVNNAAVPDGARCVLSMLPPSAHAALRDTLRRENNASWLGSVAMLSGPAPETTTPGLAELSIAPQLPALQTRGLWPTLGDLAARVAVEALSRSGRDLHPLALRRAIESMTGYEPLSGVALQYSPHQRAGLALASQWSPTP
jgi:cytochrome c553